MLCDKKSFCKDDVVFCSRGNGKNGFFLIELLVSILLAFSFIFISLYFQNTVICLYDKILMRRIALNLVINTFEDFSMNANLASSSAWEREVNISGRSFKICYGYIPNSNRFFGEFEKGSLSVIWRSGLGANEKLQLG